MITALIIGTSLRDRLPNLKELVLSIDKLNNNLITEKIITIDNFNNEELFWEDKAFFEVKGYKIISHPRKGLPLNMYEGLKHITSEWILYCEDDIILDKLPNLDDIKEYIFNNRKLGFISLVGGGYNDKKYISQIETHLRNFKNWGFVGNYDYYIRNEEYRNNHFISFPCILIRRELLLKCLEFSLKNKQGKQIEEALTESWFNLGLDKEYYTTIFLKNISDIVNLTILDWQKTFQDKHYSVKFTRPPGEGKLGGYHI